MTTLTAKLPEHLASWLARRAEMLGCSRSELVREALKQLRSGVDKASYHDPLVDVCGSVSRSEDLSTNPQYLDGFGR
jgi:Arc/MetJ-type ribon-helix-helix transcriptional regulator